MVNEKDLNVLGEISLDSFLGDLGDRKVEDANKESDNFNKLGNLIGGGDDFSLDGEEKNKETKQADSSLNNKSVDADKGSNLSRKVLYDYLVKEGEWDGDIVFKDSEGNVLSDDDYEDDDIWNKIKETQKSLYSDKFFTDDEKELIKMKEEGIDMSQYFQLQNSTKTIKSIDIENIDLSNSNDVSILKNMIFTKLTFIGNNTEKDATKYINKLDADELHNEALEAKEVLVAELKKRESNEFESKKKEVADKRSAELLFKSNLQEALKKNGKKPIEVQSIVDELTRKSDNGKTKFDLMIDDIKSNPQRFLEVYEIIKSPSTIKSKLAKDAKTEAVKEIVIQKTMGTKNTPTDNKYREIII